MMRENKGNDEFTNERINKLISEIESDVIFLGTSKYANKSKITKRIYDNLDLLKNALKDNSTVSIHTTDLDQSLQTIADADVEQINENPPKRLFSISDLSYFDGTNGKPAYVAVDGIVYDLSNNPFWVQGVHMGVRAGYDLSVNYGTCHPGMLIIKTMPVVGFLQK